jgi:hypothetical protein
MKHQSKAQLAKEAAAAAAVKHLDYHSDLDARDLRELKRDLEQVIRATMGLKTYER